MRVVCNASPLIGLEQIKKLDLLALFDAVFIAPAVAREVMPTIPALPPQINIQPLTQPLSAQILRASLGAGESETIALALETNTSIVILDDLAARRLATRLGLRPLGTLGVLLIAKNRGAIPAVKPLIDELSRFHFHASDALIRQVLEKAGEA